MSGNSLELNSKIDYGSVTEMIECLSDGIDNIIEKISNEFCCNIEKITIKARVCGKGYFIVATPTFNNEEEYDSINIEAGRDISYDMVED